MPRTERPTSQSPPPPPFALRAFHARPGLAIGSALIAALVTGVIVWNVGSDARDARAAERSTQPVEAVDPAPPPDPTPEPEPELEPEPEPEPEPARAVEDPRTAGWLAEIRAAVTADLRSKPLSARRRIASLRARFPTDPSTERVHLEIDRWERIVGDVEAILGDVRAAIEAGPTSRPYGYLAEDQKTHILLARLDGETCVFESKDGTKVRRYTMTDVLSDMDAYFITRWVRQRSDDEQDPDALRRLATAWLILPHHPSFELDWRTIVRRALDAGELAHLGPELAAHGFDPAPTSDR